MAQIHVDLLRGLKSLEKEVQAVFAEKEQAFRYRWQHGKAKFEDDVLVQHKKLKQWLPDYLRQARASAVLTAPFIYVGIIPFLLLDLFLALFQLICFPVYGIPKVHRADYIVFDRGALKYLNSLERLNCVYCSYANGLLAYATEVAGRTEQHWCPIKHANRLRAPHSRYPHFIDYGDASRYRSDVEAVRKDFVDLRDIAPVQQAPSERET